MWMFEQLPKGESWYVTFRESIVYLWLNTPLLSFSPLPNAYHLWTNGPDKEIGAVGIGTKPQI